MEFVEGTDLGRYVRQRGPMPIADACDCIVQIADALQLLLTAAAPRH
jgi:serine/threonine protein kinase